jgi:hypothetical protein
MIAVIGLIRANPTQSHVARSQSSHPEPNYYNRQRLEPIVALAISLAALSGCSDPDLCNTERVAFHASPDQIVQAVVVRTNCGATTSYAYKVHMALVGEDTAETDAFFVADDVDSIEIRWRSPQHLEIAYNTARIFKFRNFWNLEYPGTREMVRAYSISLAELHADADQ